MPEQNEGILLIWPLGTNFNEISIEIHTYSFKKMHLKMSSGKWRPFCLGLNVVRVQCRTSQHWWEQLLGVTGSKPLPEPVLTMTHDTTWSQWVNINNLLEYIIFWSDIHVAEIQNFVNYCLNIYNFLNLQIGAIWSFNGLSIWCEVVTTFCVW